MSYKIRLRTKNPSAKDLRTMLSTVKTRVPIVVRLGSRSDIPRVNGLVPLEINSIEGITNSRNKSTMKTCFEHANVKTAKWWHLNQPDVLVLVESYPAIIKHIGSHSGGGIFLINTQEELQEWIRAHGNLSSYIIEEYKNFTKEYRLHVAKDGCFYTCRKMLKADATERWHRHDSNCVWIVEENPLFEKPKNWDDIIAECVKALHAVGLDTGACDVKVQSEKGKRDSFIPDFIIMEINSAPSMGEITTVKYFEKITEIIKEYE